MEGTSIRRASSERDASASESRQPLRLHERLGLDAEQRDPALTLEPADAAGQPEHRRDVDSGHVSEALERRSVLDRDQPPQVLANEVVQRYAVRCLVLLAAHERRPVALGEERESEADDEEGCRDHRIAGVAGERERSEPQAQRWRAAAGEPLDDPQRRPQQPRDEDGSREGDERGQQQSQIAVPTPARELEHDEADRGQRRRIQEPEPGSRCPHRDRADEDRGRGEQRRAVPAQALRTRGRCGLSTSQTGAPARCATTAPPTAPTASPIAVPANASAPDSATVTSASCQPRAPYQASRLRAAARSVRNVIAASSANANRSAAASPPTIPSRRPAARLVACASRSSSTGATRSKLDVTDLELRTRLRHTGREIVDLPEARLPRSQRGDPGVAAVERFERGSPGERPHPLGEEERRRRRAVVPRGSRYGGAHFGIEERVVGRGEEVAEEDAIVQHRLPDLDDPQSGRMRQPPLAAQAQHLAALRCTAYAAVARTARVTQFPSPSTPPRPANVPAIVVSRKRTSDVAGASTACRSATRARRSSAG